MGGNVQCPVCTLFLLPGMDLSDHLETHPKEQVIKALVQMSLKFEVTETVTPDNPKNTNATTPFTETDINQPAPEDGKTTPTSETCESTARGIEKQREMDEHTALTQLSPANNSGNRPCGYLFENNSNSSSSSSSSSSNNFFGPPTPYYQHNHQSHSQHHHQQQQQQQPQHNHLQNYHPYHGHPGPSQQPLRLFSYQPTNKPLQPPPAYGAAISQLRSQNSQNLMVNNVNRPQYMTANYTSSTLTGASSSLPPPLPPPPLSQRYQSNLEPLETPSFADTCHSNAMSPRRSSLTPPIRPPPQLYRSPLSSAGQNSRQSNSPYSVMTGSPSVLRFAESPVTAHYLERENGDFIVQETPKHVVECVEKDDGEFSVIERVYHMPPSVVQINEDLDDELSSDHGSNCEDIKMLDEDLPSGTWSGRRSPEQGPITEKEQQKKSGITVLSDVQLDLNEYLDLMGNIIASSKVAKNRTDMIKIEKFEPEEVKEEIASNCLEGDEYENMDDDAFLETEKKEDAIDESSTCIIPVAIAAACSTASVVSPSSMVVEKKQEATDESSSRIIPKDITTACTSASLISVLSMDEKKPEATVESSSCINPVDIAAVCASGKSTSSLPLNKKKEEPTDESSSYIIPAGITVERTSASVTPASSVTSVIRLATNPNARSNTPWTPSLSAEEARTETKLEETGSSTSFGMEVTKFEEPSTSILATEETMKEASFNSNTEKVESTDSTIAKVEAAVKAVSLTDAQPQPQINNNIPEKQDNFDMQVKKEERPPAPAYHLSVRRPIKKTPKKLVIKPRSKEPIASTSIQIQKPSTSTEIPPLEPPQKEEVLSEATKAKSQENELKSIKTERLPTTSSDSMPPPLFADADEKLPPDDDLQPSTSYAIVNSPVLASTSSDDKPTADLSAFLDQCMKKEEEADDHPIHSLFVIESVPEPLNDASNQVPAFPSASLFSKPLTKTTNGEQLSISESILPDKSNKEHDPSPSLQPAFPSASLFSKPLSKSTEQLIISETILPDSSDIQEPEDPSPPPAPAPPLQQPQHQQQQNNSTYVEYPFSFLYGTNHEEEIKHNISPPIYCTEDFNKYSASTSGGNSASCTWYQSQSSENDFEMGGKGSYLDLDSCKRSTSFAAATEGSMPTTDTLNIRTDEKMPAKGEISEQESNCGVENSWSQSLYNEFPVRFPNTYQNFMAVQETWSHDNYFRPQDLTSPVETKNFSLRLTEESPIMDTLPSTSKRKAKTVAKLPRKKTFQCAHCKTHFPLLKEKNAHLIKQHGYKRVNRRLIRDPPTSTVTTATMNTDAGASLLLGLEPSALPPALGEEEDSKASIVKIEQDSKAAALCEDRRSECKETIPNLSLTRTVQTATNANVSRTKYDSMRARDNRMLINFNLNALSIKNEGKAEVETHSFYKESKSAFFCFVCQRDFLTNKLFDEHLVEHPAECFTCHKTFTRWKNFMVHLKRHLGWKDFGCTICEKKFVIRSALVEHMRMHTGQTPLKCKVCGKSFKRYSNLTQHRKRHGNRINRNKEYVCYCGEVLPSKARFIWHKETHDLKPKCCPYCRDRFVHANSLRRHIRLAHSDKFDYTEPMECPMCKQIYAKSSIKAHMATHSMDTQHECLICSKSFSTKWNLKIHNWVHANRTMKPFKCNQCVKAFVREVDYNNHMNSHKQIKPYTCEHCGCKFIRKYNYIRHRREHHGNKKFTCDLCGKLFHRHYYLIEHRRIHTGERPFQCTICGKSSTTKTNHNKHLKIHHSRDPFTSEA